MACRAGIAGVIAAALVVATYGCGKEELINSLKGSDTGEVPGKFMAKLSPLGLTKADDLKGKIQSFAPDAKLSQFFGESENDTLGLTGKLTDIYAIDLPDTGISSVNAEMFKQLQGLTTGDQAYLASVDTDKHIGGDFINMTLADYNDTEFKSQYYLEMIRWKEARESLTSAQIEAAAPVLVAVLDTGVQSDHEDLKDVMFKGSDGKALGYDSFALAEGVPKDNGQHGTHVAGIIGGTGNNGKGIYGVGFLPKASGKSVTEILSVTVLNEKGSGTTREASRGLRWAVQKQKSLKTQTGREKQKLIVNMSLGGPFETSGYSYSRDTDGRFKDEMFTYAQENDVLVVVAAGNESCEIGGHCDVGGKQFSEAFYYPCSYQHVLCVAASTHEEKLAGFSNRRDSVGIVAPGWLIKSTIPTDGTTSYADFNGTSMATPVTAGAAAMVWSLYPDFTAKDISDILKNSAARISDITGQTKAQAGRVDLKAALEYAAALKAQGKKPAALAASPSSTAITPSTPPTSSADPNAGSSKVGGNSETEKSGCAIGADLSGANAWWILVLLLAPLVICTLPTRRLAQLRR